jgi:hypothetical protein
MVANFLMTEKMAAKFFQWREKMAANNGCNFFNALG